jgi:hypothetical protein
MSVSSTVGEPGDEGGEESRDMLMISGLLLAEVAGILITNFANLKLLESSSRTTCLPPKVRQRDGREIA